MHHLRNARACKSSYGIVPGFPTPVVLKVIAGQICTYRLIPRRRGHDQLDVVIYDMPFSLVVRCQY